MDLGSDWDENDIEASSSESDYQNSCYSESPTKMESCMSGDMSGKWGVLNETNPS